MLGLAFPLCHVSPLPSPLLPQALCDSWCSDPRGAVLLRPRDAKYRQVSADVMQMDP